jgi:hypothetical protein
VKGRFTHVDSCPADSDDDSLSEHSISPLSSEPYSSADDSDDSDIVTRHRICNIINDGDSDETD